MRGDVAVVLDAAQGTYNIVSKIKGLGSPEPEQSPLKAPTRLLKMHKHVYNIRRRLLDACDVRISIHKRPIDFPTHPGLRPPAVVQWFGSRFGLLESLALTIFGPISRG